MLTMFRNAAEVVGCLAAPIPVVAVVVVESIFYTSFGIIAVAIFSLLAYLISLVFTVWLGYPLYRLLMRFRIFSWWASALSGFAIGAFVTVLISHSETIMSSGTLANSLAAAASGLLFWIIQRSHVDRRMG